MTKMVLECRKLNRLIEARYTSVPFSKARQPLLGKGKTAEVGRTPESFLLGRRRTSVGLSQFPVERYQWQTGIFRDICPFVGPLCRRSGFFVPGMTAREEKKERGKKL